MRTDLLKPLQVLPQLAVHAVGQDLRVLAIHDVALTIEEPCRDFVLRGVLDNGNDTLELFRCDLTGSTSYISLKFDVATMGG